jgi:hypothetical protein
MGISKTLAVLRSDWSWNGIKSRRNGPASQGAAARHHSKKVRTFHKRQSRMEVLD